jgi:hypothetical protein
MVFRVKQRMYDGRVGQEADTSSAADHHAALDVVFRWNGGDQALREWFRLRHKAPMPGANDPVLRDVGPDVMVWHDVHQQTFITRSG